MDGPQDQLFPRHDVGLSHTTSMSEVGQSQLHLANAKTEVGIGKRTLHCNIQDH